MSAETDLKFDGWTVNRLSGEAAREGRAFRLAQQPLRILLELYDHAGEVVTRDQLVKALWPAGIVDFDNGLNVAMRKLRVALEDVGDAPRYIETLPRVGYRFIGNKGTAAIAPPAEPSRLGRISLIAGLGALTAAVGIGWWVGLSSRHTFAGGRTPHHVPSVRARELYLEGLSQRSRRDVDTYGVAQEKFQAALREDPNYPEAWAAMGDALSAAVIRQRITPAEGVPRARQAAERAIALDPGAVEGHYLLGEILTDHDKNFAAAKVEFDRALRIDDRSARLWHHLGMWQGHLGHLDDALSSLRRAREIEPMTPLYAANYALLLYHARRYPEVIAFLKPQIDANPRFDQARATIALAMAATGDLDGARAQLEARRDAGPNQGDLGAVYARLGRRDDALRELARLQARGLEGYGVAYDESLIYVALGDFEQACQALSRAVGDHSLLVNWLRLEPRLDPLRGSQCYEAAEKKLYGDL